MRWKKLVFAGLINHFKTPLFLEQRQKITNFTFQTWGYPGCFISQVKFGDEVAWTENKICPGMRFQKGVPPWPNSPN